MKNTIIIIIIIKTIINKLKSIFLYREFDKLFNLFIFIMANKLFRRPTLSILESYKNLSLIGVIKETNYLNNNSLPKYIVLDLKQLKRNNLRLIYYHRKIFVISLKEITPSYFIPFEIDTPYIKLPIESISQIYNQTSSLSFTKTHNI